VTRLGEWPSAAATSLVGIVLKLKQNARWEMELLVETKKPVFRVGQIAETLDK
jgi:hypothetical protein